MSRPEKWLEARLPGSRTGRTGASPVMGQMGGERGANVGAKAGREVEVEAHVGGGVDGRAVPAPCLRGHAEPRPCVVRAARPGRAAGAVAGVEGRVGAFAEPVAGTPGGGVAGRIPRPADPEWGALQAGGGVHQEELGEFGGEGDEPRGRQPEGFVAVRVGNNEQAYWRNESGSAIWLPSRDELVAAAGGQLEIRWPGLDQDVVYTVSAVPTNRPARIYWTEAPYNAPAVYLSANNQQIYATLHYNNYVTAPVRSVVTNYDATGTNAVTTTNYADGVWIDVYDGSQCLRADGVEGICCWNTSRTASSPSRWACSRCRCSRRPWSAWRRRWATASCPWTATTGRTTWCRRSPPASAAAPRTRCSWWTTTAPTPGSATGSSPSAPPRARPGTRRSTGNTRTRAA